tara:strand:- start:8702 stop:9652 length:951 start_codon:yes stop_codon:yes gene_type:complete
MSAFGFSPPGSESMIFPARVRIVEVSPVYLSTVLNTCQRPPDLTDFVRRLTRAGVKFIAIRQNVSDPSNARLQRSRARDINIVDPRDAHFLGDALDRIPISPDEAQTLAAVTLDVTTSDAFATGAWGSSAAVRVDECLQTMAQLRDCGTDVRVRINVAFGCPYQGIIDCDDVARLAEVLYTHGSTEVILADTIGVATPRECAALTSNVAARIPRSCIGVRFHDTYGLALTNIFSCLANGVTSIESSLGGVHAPARGNYLQTPVTTEDVVHLLRGLDIECGVDLHALVAASHYIARARGQAPISRTAMALDAIGCRT